MLCLSRILLITVCLVESSAQDAGSITITHGNTKGNVVKGKNSGDKERADLKDVQKFFPKVTAEEEGKKDKEGELDGFTDSIASSLDDSQAELLVAGQKPSTVCARDIKRFCGADAMKQKHPIHCLGLLKDDQRAQIHKLCRVHLQESLTFTCANDMARIGCDPVMSSTIDCLTEGIDKLSHDCLDQTRLVAKVIAKVNNAHIEVTTKDVDGKTIVTKVHDGVYNDGNWKCPNSFMEHHTHAPCCYYMGDCSDREKNNFGNSKFKCAKNQCSSHGGRWVLKDPEGMELAGHLCCPTKKNGVQTYADYRDPTDDAPVSKGSSGGWFYFIVLAALVYWQRNRVMHVLNVCKQIAKGEITNVHLPGRSIELSTFVSGIFSAIKKPTEFVKVPRPKKQQPDAAAGYGGM